MAAQMSSTNFWLPELLLHVMDHCADTGDFKALQACSLVSKTWQLPAQGHLLSSVWIFTDVTERNPSSFISLLNSSSRLRPYVRDVYIRMSPPDPDSFPAYTDLKVHELRIILSKVSCIRLLCLDVGITPSLLPILPSGEDITSHKAQMVMPRFKIKYLHLEAVRLCQLDGSFNDALHDLLGLFTEVDTLHLARAWDGWAQEERPAQVLPVERSQVHSLKLSFAYITSRIMESLMQCTSQNNLRMLYLDDGSWSCQECQLCLDAATHLQELYVRIDSSQSFEIFYHVSCELSLFVP